VSTDSNTDASGTVKDKLETWEMTTNTTTNDDDDKGALSSSSSSAFTKGTQNTADFEMTAQASLKVFQGVEYNANAAAQTTEDIAAAFHQSGAGAAMLNKHLKTNLVGGHGGAAAGMPRERKSRYVMRLLMVVDVCLLLFFGVDLLLRVLCFFFLLFFHFFAFPLSVSSCFLCSFSIFPFSAS
jgi:hypothetical protein